MRRVGDGGGEQGGILVARRRNGYDPTIHQTPGGINGPSTERAEDHNGRLAALANNVDGKFTAPLLDRRVLDSRCNVT